MSKASSRPLSRVTGIYFDASDPVHHLHPLGRARQRPISTVLVVAVTLYFWEVALTIISQTSFDDASLN